MAEKRGSAMEASRLRVLTLAVPVIWTGELQFTGTLAVADRCSACTTILANSNVLYNYMDPGVAATRLWHNGRCRWDREILVQLCWWC